MGVENIDTNTSGNTEFSVEITGFEDASELLPKSKEAPQIADTSDRQLEGLALASIPETIGADIIESTLDGVDTDSESHSGISRKLYVEVKNLTYNPDAQLVEEGPHMSEYQQSQPLRLALERAYRVAGLERHLDNYSGEVWTKRTVEQSSESFIDDFLAETSRLGIDIFGAEYDFLWETPQIQSKMKPGEFSSSTREIPELFKIWQAYCAREITDAVLPLTDKEGLKFSEISEAIPDTVKSIFRKLAGNPSILEGESADDIFSTYFQKIIFDTERWRQYYTEKPENIRDGLSLDETIRGMVASGIEESFENRVTYLRQITELGGRDAAKKLYEQFGIRHFQRYDPEKLLAQLEEQPENPVLVITAADDHNGVLDGNQENVNTIYGEDTPRVYFEARTKRNLAEALIKFRKQYGAAKNLILFAHGSPDGMSFGHIQNGSINKAEVVQSSSIKRLINSRFLAQDSQIIFNSCSTGAQEGIASEIARQSGVRVQAPSEKIIRFALGVDNEGKVIFNVGGEDAALTASVY